MKHRQAFAAPPPRRITVDLEREFFCTYPELAGRVRRARAQRPAPRAARWRRWCSALLTAIALLVLVWLAPGDARAVEPGPVAAGTLLLRGADGTQAALVLATEVDIDAAALHAEVKVRQTFRNRSADYREGTYLFPLPEQAAIHAMRLRVGQRVIEGEIRARELAEQSYREAAKGGWRASLLQQQRPNLFTLTVANIAPGEQVTVELGYLQQLDFRDGAFELRFPMTLTPRFAAGARDAAAVAAPLLRTATAAGQRQRVTLQARVASAQPLQLIESLYHPIEVEQGADYRVTLRDDDVPADRDFVLRWAAQPQATPSASVFGELRDDAAYALILLHPPAPAFDPAPLPRELVFVLDVSGSMAGAPLRQAKTALATALAQLQRGDYFNIVVFADSARALFPASVPAAAHTIPHAQDFVAGLVARGGTVMAPALALALSGNAPLQAVRQVVFITDGAVANEAALFELVAEELGEARLFPVAIGSAPNSYFMREAAHAGRGTFTYIGNTEEVDQRMRALLTKLREPLLSDISVQWPPELAAQVLPAAAADLYAGQPLVLNVRARALRGQVTVRGRRAGMPWSQTLQLDAHTPVIGAARLWARERIATLERSVRLGADADTRRAAQAQIVALAVEHGLVSRYTSLVAVEHQPSRPWQMPLMPTALGSELPVGSAMLAYPAGATDARLRLLLGMGALLAAAFLARVNWRPRSAPRVHR